ncbi:MAG: phosphatase PAP2 family protein [Deltaproteobacteria bacterium]|nr:phosphatase PAP2 family protein [Deltaproteobacteria bacterium]MBW2394015.1 phosphatase PAP2 family protein [Deltaproteobacteria bacterium]
MRADSAPPGLLAIQRGPGAFGRRSFGPELRLWERPQLGFGLAGDAPGPPRPLGSWWTTFGMGATYALQRTLLDGPDRPRWKGGILFDDWVRDHLKSGSRDGRSDANTASDIFLGALYTYLLADTWLAGDKDDRLERLRINLDAVIMSSMTNDFFKAVAARERPVGINSRSFFSGHAAGAATAAGLICVHHYADEEPDGFADGAICGTAVLGAIATGAFRVVSDRHYATDVLAGWASGFFFGYFLPSRWYYGHGQQKTSFTVLPIVSSRGFGFQVNARF